MRLLLGSGGLRTAERLQSATSRMREHFGAVSRILFVPYAGHDFDMYVHSIQERGLDAGYALDSIHRHRDPRAAVERAEAIFVGGGNTFRLLAALQELGLIELIRERVLSGVPYLGISAGVNVACPTIMTTNDMPIMMPPHGLAATGLVPFQINPHYFAGQTFIQNGEGLTEHFGETRDERILEFHQHSTTPVIGLWEGAFLTIEGSRMQLGDGGARIFRCGQRPEDVVAGADLSTLLAA